MRNLDFSQHLLVSRYQGALPVILTAPHGGDQQPPGVPKERSPKNLPAECRFEKNTDRFTRTITRGVAQALFDVFGAAPYVVMADFDRAFIDANRSPECAFDDPDARQFYDEYHHTIRGFIDEIRTDNGGLGLLFDIHGTTKIKDDPADVYLGTLNHAAITTLLNRDPQAMTRKRSLPGSLLAAGYVVSTKVPETLQGDFTLEANGSANANGIDAIQIEIEADLRIVDTKRDLFIEDLGFALSTLVARYTDDLPFATFRSANFLPRLQRGASESSGTGVPCT